MPEEENKSTSLPPHEPDLHGESSPVQPDHAEQNSHAHSETTTYTVEDQFDSNTDAYGNTYVSQAGGESLPAVVSSEPPPPPPPASAGSDDEEDDDDEGMVRMSFLEHLEELRARLIRGLAGLGVAFLLCMYFSEPIWGIVQEPAAAALRSIGYNDATLVFTSPMESFMIIWFKLPLLVSLFVASPWILFQAWSFIAPGLYKKERRMAVPFVLSTAGLFIIGGLFAYFIAFRFGLAFLLGVGRNVGVRPMITITEYFDIFVNVILGVGVVFEMPVLIFMLTLLRIASPKFLIEHSRYAILIIFIIAAVITPTPDVFNLMLFAVPMVVLYFIGIFASYLLVLSREGRKFPWAKVLLISLGVVLILAAVVTAAVMRYGYHFSPNPPWLVR